MTASIGRRSGGGYPAGPMRPSRWGRGRSGARAPLGGGFPAPALSVCWVGSHFHLGPRFPGPPCDPGRSDFPSPVLTLAFLWRSARYRRNSSADSRTPLSTTVYLQARSCFEGLRNPGSVSGPPLEPPSAQSFFARVRCYLPRGTVQQPLGGRYASFVARTGSCASPKPSRRLCALLLLRVFAGCCRSLLEDGPSRRYLCGSFPRCLGLCPGASRGAYTRFFPRDVGLHHPLPVARLDTMNPLEAASCGGYFGTVTIRYRFRPPGWLATLTAPTLAVARRAAVALTSEQNSLRFLCEHRTC